MSRNTTHAARLWELIKHIEVAMLTTQESDGSLHSRPMAALQTDFEGDLWFFTEASSHKVDDINVHRHVNVSYVDADKNRYVSISGRAQVVRDEAKARELWRPFLRAWFPRGVDDPEVALLRVKVERAEYWESPSSKMVQLLDFLTTTAAGEEYRPVQGKKVSVGR
jgi:general stress protein 26